MRKTLGELLLVALPKIAGGGLTFLFNVILLRYLGPEQFGIYSLCVAAILLSEGIIGTPFDFAVLRLAQRHLDSAPGLALLIEQSAIWLKLLTISIAGGIAALLAPWIEAQVFAREDTAHLVYFSVFAVCAMLLFRSVLTHVQVRRRFAHYGALDLLHIVIKFGGIGLLIALSVPSPDSLLTFWVLGPLLATGLGLHYVARPLLHGLSWKRQSVAEVFLFSKWYLLTTALGATMGKMDIFMLSGYTRMYEVGLYSGALVFALIPELLGTYIATVLSPRIVPACKAGTFAQLFARVQLLLLGGAALIFLLAWWLWEPLSGLLLPPQYQRSAEVLLILLPGSLAGMTTFPLALAFVLFAHKKLLFYLDLASLPFLVACYVWLLPDYGAIGAAWIASTFHVVRSIIVQLLAFVWSRRHDPLGDCTPEQV